MVNKLFFPPPTHQMFKITISVFQKFVRSTKRGSIRTSLQRTLQNDMIIHQMDVKTACLNVPTDCEIYIEQPEGFQKFDKKGEKLVCKLKRSLYGLKQRGRNLLYKFLMTENGPLLRSDTAIHEVRSPA